MDAPKIFLVLDAVVIAWSFADLCFNFIKLMTKNDNDKWVI